MNSFFSSISVISLAKALTLAFIAPLIVTAFSPIFLGEKVGYRRWAAVIIGFIIAGFSVSSIIPICYTFVSSIKNVNATVGITIITIGVYWGFMIAPPALGYVADIFGIEFVYIPMLILFIISSIIVTSQQKLFKN